MRLSSKLPLLSLASAISAHGKMFHWPAYDLDWIDSVLYELPFFENFTANCAARDNTTVAAQWIRMAFHDMSTHNIDDGTGGLDGSIIFEFDRAENIGQNRSILDFTGFSAPFFGLADMFAAGVVVGSVSCDGPLVPYRAGRIDATSAGPLGVPQPQEDLALLTERFQKAGFTSSEMISLTACGHVLGGVTQQDFPEILKNDSFVFFNDKNRRFDNGVVTQYLDGTTTNPLVVGVNETMNSDLRIFSSDGNTTMKSISDPETFRSTCASLFEKMINTVPQSVTLSDVIDPFEFKVGKARIAVARNSSSLVMSTTLRLLDPKDNPRRQVNLVWVDTEGSSPQVSPSTNASSVGTTLLTKGHGKTAVQYSFNLDNIDPQKSIGRFWFEIDEQDGSPKTLVKNDDGNDFVIEEHDVLYDVTRSKIRFSADQTNFTSTIVVAVKDELSDNAKIKIRTFNPFMLPFGTEDLEAAQDPEFPKHAGYTFFSASPTFPLTNSFDVYYGEIAPENMRQEFGLVFEAKDIGILA